MFFGLIGIVALVVAGAFLKSYMTRNQLTVLGLYKALISKL